MTRVLYEPAKYRLCVEGHAMASTDGVDPVCAGISALAWTLADAASNRPDYGAVLHIDPNGPVIDVRCVPKPAAMRTCRYMFEVIMGGLQLIAEAHPENVEIKIGG